ncbi:MAG: hypothetical protein C5S48_10225 [Candidatus Methanogaster sp.]|nr:MAG: hypothetical protein C5S48_10225 [ANME-2 cluster archaeon]
MNRAVEEMKPSRIDIGDVIMSPFNLLSEHHRLFVPLMIGVVFNIFMEIGMRASMPTMFTDITSASGSDSIVPEISSSTWVTYGIIILIVFIVSLSVGALMEGWVTAMMVEIKADGVISSGARFSIISANVGAIIVGAILMCVIIFAGFICLVIPGIIFAVALSCVIPAIVLHNVGAIEGLKASWKFCWQGQNFWRLFALLSLMGVIALIPVIGSILLAFISPLWSSYAYMEYVRAGGSE